MDGSLWLVSLASRFTPLNGRVDVSGRFAKERNLPEADFVKISPAALLLLRIKQRGGCMAKQIGSFFNFFLDKRKERDVRFCYGIL